MGTFNIYFLNATGWLWIVYQLCDKPMTPSKLNGAVPNLWSWDGSAALFPCLCYFCLCTRCPCPNNFPFPEPLYKGKIIINNSNNNNNNQPNFISTECLLCVDTGIYSTYFIQSTSGLHKIVCSDPQRLKYWTVWPIFKSAIICPIILYIITCHYVPWMQEL